MHVLVNIHFNVNIESTFTCIVELDVFPHWAAIRFVRKYAFLNLQPSHMKNLNFGLVLNILTIRAFGSGHIDRYRQPGEDPISYRYRNVISTNALGDIKILPADFEISFIDIMV